MFAWRVIKMDEQKAKIVDHYLKQINGSLVGFRKTKKYFMREFSVLVTSYAEERQDVTIDDLHEEFGTPESFASQFTERTEYAELLKRAKKKSLLWMIAAIVGIVVIACLICFIVYLISQYGEKDIVSGVYEPAEKISKISQSGGRV